MYEITVAVCVYKQKEWLHRCLRSLNSQTLEKSRYEVVVVNDDPNETLDDVIDIILELRNNARKNKDFSLSDKIRDMLNKKGISINDSDKNSSYTID